MYPNLFVLALLPQKSYFLLDCRCKYSTQTNIQSLASDSVIGLHLLQNPACAHYYEDSRFSILAQGRSLFHLSALEATFIKTSNPFLCKRNSCTASRLGTNDAFSLVLFQPITVRFFPINSRSFRVLSILAILRDKCQTKSCSEDINILFKAYVLIPSR